MQHGYPQIQYKDVLQEDIFELIRKGDIYKVYNSIQQSTERDYVNLKNCNGLSLLSYSICHNKLDIAKLLIYLKADKEHCTEMMESPFNKLLNPADVNEFGQNFVTQIEKFEVAKLGMTSTAEHFWVGM